MSRAPLHVVSPDEPRPAKAESLAERMRRLQVELAGLSRDQLTQLNAALIDASKLAAEVADNASQPPGIRDVARRLVEDCEMRVQTLEALSARSGR